MPRVLSFFSLVFFLLLPITVHGSDIDLEGRLIVVNKRSDDVSFIDLPTLRETARIAVGKGPHEVAVSPDGSTALVTNYGGGPGSWGSTVSVISVADKKVIKTIDLGYQAPHGITWFSDGRRAAVTAEGSNRLLVIDVPKGAVSGAYDTEAPGSHMVALLHDESGAWTTNIPDGSVTFIDFTSGKAVTKIKTARGAEGIGLHPDNGELWVGNIGAASVSIIDSSEKTLLETIQTGNTPIRIAFTPDGKRTVLSHNADRSIAVYDTDTRKLLKTVSMKTTDAERTAGLSYHDAGGGPAPVSILIDPSGRYLFVATPNADLVHIVDLDTYRILHRIPVAVGPDGLALILNK